MSRELGDGAFYVFYVGPSYFILLDLREGYGPKTVKHLTQMGRKRQEKQRSEPQSHRGQPASSELRRAKEDRGQRSEPQSLDPQMLNSGFWILDAGYRIPDACGLILATEYGERMTHPTCGCGLRCHLIKTNKPAICSLIQNDVSLALRIPVCNPDWTDHNASEPGITLIEVFAFMAENLLYRSN
jgi:hypothetical protein